MLTLLPLPLDIHQCKLPLSLFICWIIIGLNLTVSFLRSKDILAEIVTFWLGWAMVSLLEGAIREPEVYSRHIFDLRGAMRLVNIGNEMGENRIRQGY